MGKRKKETEGKGEERSMCKCYVVLGCSFSVRSKSVAATFGSLRSFPFVFSTSASTATGSLFPFPFLLLCGGRRPSRFETLRFHPCLSGDLAMSLIAPKIRGDNSDVECQTATWAACAVPPSVCKFAMVESLGKARAWTRVSLFGAALLERESG